MCAMALVVPSKFDEVKTKMLQYQGKPKGKIMNMTITHHSRPRRRSPALDETLLPTTASMIDTKPVTVPSAHYETTLSSTKADIEVDADPYQATNEKDTTEVKKIVGKVPQQTKVKHADNGFNTDIHGMCNIDEEFNTHQQETKRKFAEQEEDIPKPSMSSFSHTLQEHLVPAMNVVTEGSFGPHEMRYQPTHSELVELVRRLEAVQTDLRRRMSENNKAFAKHKEETKRISAKQDEDIKVLKKEVECMKLKFDAIQKENELLIHKPIVPPESLIEWLGVDIPNVHKIAMNDKLITYFSKALFPQNINITGSYFGFSDAEIHGISYDSNNSSRECCRLLLKRWCNKQGEKATLELLLQTFYKISQRETVCIDFKCLREALKKARNTSLYNKQ